MDERYQYCFVVSFSNVTIEDVYKKNEELYFTLEHDGERFDVKYPARKTKDRVKKVTSKYKNEGDHRDVLVTYEITFDSGTIKQYSNIEFLGNGLYYLLTHDYSFEVKYIKDCFALSKKKSIEQRETVEKVLQKVMPAIKGKTLGLVFLGTKVTYLEDCLDCSEELPMVAEVDYGEMPDCVKLLTSFLIDYFKPKFNKEEIAQGNNDFYDNNIYKKYEKIDLSKYTLVIKKNITFFTDKNRISIHNEQLQKQMVMK